MEVTKPEPVCHVAKLLKNLVPIIECDIGYYCGNMRQSRIRVSQLHLNYIRLNACFSTNLI